MKANMALDIICKAKWGSKTYPVQAECKEELCCFGFFVDMLGEYLHSTISLSRGCNLPAPEGIPGIVDALNQGQLDSVPTPAACDMNLSCQPENSVDVPRGVEKMAWSISPA